MSAAGICEVGGEGMFLPATTAEHSWPTALRAVLYAAGLIYSFMGVAVAADVFMASIEAVTSHKWSQELPGNRRKTVRRWNATVATLTLMALGSSAPEIFLSVIDIIKKQFHFGTLGPSTIVGSAAFNLLMIVAVCIVVIPQGEVRLIKNLPAFYITAIFSMGAYLWMAFILVYSTPGIVDVWEALVTLFLMLPLVYISYKVDRGDVDGLLRLCRVVSVEDEAMAAKPSGVNVDWKKTPVYLSDGEGDEWARGTSGDGEQYTVVWHNRADGWQAQTFDNLETGEKRYKELPVSTTRALMGSDGRPITSWFLSRRWGRYLRTFYASLKGGNYLKFSGETHEVDGSSEEVTVEVTINRTGEVDAEASCSFRTEAMTAVAGFDYEALEGTLEFGPGETQKILSLTIYSKAAWRRECLFLLVLDEAEGDFTFDPTDDGGVSRAILTVKLKPSAEYSGNRSMLKYLESVVSVYGLMLGFEDWKEQLTSWIFVNGSREEQAEASCSDWFFHVIGLPWKLMSAIMPPASFFGGWLAFCTALFVIGILTAVVSDLAELLGCVVGVPDIVTAVTLVALGTSMPDLFASLTAAKEDDTADASVVNVTGSNSVNVFLGLGFPWTIAALYWQITGRTDDWVARYPEEAALIDGVAFVVKSKNLGYSVVVFCGMCTFALLILHMRRKWLGAELGGPLAPKYAVGATFAFYWALFVAMVSWRVLRWELSELPSALTPIAGVQVWVEGLVVHVVGAVLFLGFTSITLYLTRRQRVTFRSSASSGRDDCSEDNSQDKSMEDGHLDLRAGPHEKESHNDVSHDSGRSIQVAEVDYCCYSPEACFPCGSSRGGLRSNMDKVFSRFQHFQC